MFIFLTHPASSILTRSISLFLPFYVRILPFRFFRMIYRIVIYGLNYYPFGSSADPVLPDRCSSTLQHGIEIERNVTPNPGKGDKSEGGTFTRTKGNIKP